MVKDMTPPPVTVKVRIPEESNALAVGKNGNTTLRGLGFWLRADDRVGIDLYGSRNMPLNAGAYSIPKDLMNQLCKEWLEAQGYRVFDRTADSVSWVFSEDPDLTSLSVTSAGLCLKGGTPLIQYETFRTTIEHNFGASAIQIEKKGYVK
jgi:hypothetical protein